MQDKYFKQNSNGWGPILLELFPFAVLNGFCIGFYAYAIIGHTWADQLLPQLLMEQFDTFPIHVDTLNICMKEFGSEKIIFDKMTAVRTYTIFP